MTKSRRQQWLDCDDAEEITFASWEGVATLFTAGEAWCYGASRRRWVEIDSADAVTKASPLTRADYEALFPDLPPLPEHPFVEPRNYTTRAPMWRLDDDTDEPPPGKSPQQKRAPAPLLVIRSGGSDQSRLCQREQCGPQPLWL